MLRELWAYVRLLNMDFKEMALEKKLIKHRIKMVDAYKSIIQDFPNGFRMEEAAWELGRLESKIHGGFK